MVRIYYSNKMVMFEFSSFWVYILFIQVQEINCLNICSNQDINIRSSELYGTRVIYQTIQQEYQANRSVYGINVNFDNNQIYPNRSSWMRLIDTGDGNSIAYSLLQIPMATNEEKMYPQLVSYPILAGALTFVYNLPNVTDLNLTPEIIANIYLGKITNWNDTALQAINPDIILPEQKIIYQITKSDPTSDTYVLTSILSLISDEWRQSYGVTVDTFPDNTTVPLNKLSYGFGFGAAKYSIVYTAWSNIALYTTMRPANIISNGVVYPVNQANVKASTVVAENKGNTSLITSIPNPLLLTIGYPFIYFHYIVINMTTPSNISCCSMQETVGLLDFFLDEIVKKKTAFFSKYGYVNVGEKTMSFIRNSILSMVTCNGVSMTSEYKKYIVLPTVYNDNWQLGLGLGVSLGLVLIMTLTGFGWYYKNVKFANETLWLINANEISIQYDNKSLLLMIGSVKSINSINSTQTTKSTTRKVVKKFNLATAFWKKNQNIVFIRAMKLNQVSSWRRKTKLLMTSFTKEFDHPNLCPVFGICLIEAVPTVISSSCAKGTLHYVLATSPYQMSIEVKYILAHEVLSGLKYLHQKNITHGTLNSVTCYVDAKWNVKLTDWITHTIMESEFAEPVQEDYTHFEDDHALIRLLYMDAECIITKKPTMPSDMYSYGMMLVEIFTRQIPYSEEVEFGDNTYPDIMNRKLKNIESPPMLNPVDVPNELKHLIITLIGAISQRPTVQSTFEQMRKFHCKSGESLVDIVMQTLEKYVEDLEEKVVERTSDLTHMTNRMKMLLNEVLPPQIATKFINEEPMEPEFYECATIFFSDIVGFTVISAKSTPIQVMNFLNELWNLFDNLMVSYDVYKVDTIGDAYMVASGLPIRNGVDHCKHIADLALSLRRSVKYFTLPHLPGESVRIRMGINSGPVTAGIVGHKMPQYCVFGDTVNTASRMESTSLPSKIQVSAFSKTLLNDYFPDYKFECRGEIEIKGKGSMKTYWLLDL